MYAAIALAGVGFGASLPILALLLESRHVPGVLIGLNTAMTALAGFMVTPLVPRALVKLGAARLLILCLVIVAATLIIMRLWVNVWLWFPLRFVLGAALSMLFTAAEYWVSAAAHGEARGRAVGIYVMIFSAGWAIGPLLIALLGWQSWEVMAAVLALMAAAIVPLAFSTNAAPAPEAAAPASFKALFRSVPLATFAAFVFGGVELGIFALLPIYALRAGLPAADGVTFLTAVAIGNIALQVPLGLLIDKIGVRPVLILSATAGLAGAAGLPFLLHTPVWLYAALVLWGGLVTGLYTAALVLLGQEAEGAALAVANSAVVMAYSLGGLLIPPLSGWSMDLWRPHGLMAVLGGLCASYVLVAFWLPSRVRATA